MANNNKFPQELVEKAMQCETAEELLKLAKENGVELTMEEAEAYLAEGAAVNLDEEEMARVAGGADPQCIMDGWQCVMEGLYPCVGNRAPSI